MDWQSHRMFGKIIAEQYGLPIHNYLEYTILPDLRYYKESYFKYVFFHRWTLHGPENIDTVIDQGKYLRYVEYNAEYDNYIKCLIMSHSYLDLFNFIIHPSYPGNYGFTYIRSQLPKIFTFRAIKAPKGLDNVLQDIVKSHSGPFDLFHTMLIEYRCLPEKKYWVRQILKLY